MRKAVLAGVILASFAMAGLVWYLVLEPEAENNGEAMAAVLERFEDKIVYDYNEPEVDLADLRRDCSNRGGEFNECGSACPSDAEVCIMVCVPICELDT